MISAMTSHDKATLVAKRLQAETTLKDWKLQLDLTTVALGELEAGLHEDVVFEAMATAWREFSESRPRLEKPWGRLFQWAAGAQGEGTAAPAHATASGGHRKVTPLRGSRK